jgi:hypothetical protein
MKKLNNLIPDIYKPLEELSSGKPLDISEKELNITIDNIKKAILNWSNPGERNSKFNLRMSNIGKPARQLWYEKRDTAYSWKVNGPTQIKFLYGHILEEILLMLVRMSGHKVTDEQKEVKVSGITGHIDCKIDGEVVDIKTASNFAFNKFKEGKLSDDDPFGYLDQLASYEASEGTDEGGFLVINKESGELCFYQPEELDKKNMKTAIPKVIAAIDSNRKPDKCYSDISDGKKGNKKLSKPCTYCNYKYDCHSDANGGDGLRVFKYSYGPVYLTHIESVPRVEEILWKKEK